MLEDAVGVDALHGQILYRLLGVVPQVLGIALVDVRRQAPETRAARTPLPERQERPRDREEPPPPGAGGRARQDRRGGNAEEAEQDTRQHRLDGRDARIDPGERAIADWVADGKRVKDYQLVYRGEETLDTPLGKVDTLHFERVHDDPDRKSDTWVAPAWDYLMVKTVHVEDGKPTELIITGGTIGDQPLSVD